MYYFNAYEIRALMYIYKAKLNDAVTKYNNNNNKQ